MKKEIKLGLTQAIEITVYCGFVGLVVYNGEKIFGQMKSPIGPVAFLTMFAVSVLICGLLVFKKPYELFFEGRKKEALNVVVYTAASLFVILIALFMAMFCVTI